MHVPIDNSYLHLKNELFFYLNANDIVYRINHKFSMYILKQKLSIYSILLCCLNYIFDVVL